MQPYQSKERRQTNKKKRKARQKGKKKEITTQRTKKQNAKEIESNYQRRKTKK